MALPAILFMRLSGSVLLSLSGRRFHRQKSLLAFFCSLVLLSFSNCGNRRFYKHFGLLFQVLCSWARLLFGLIFPTISSAVFSLGFGSGIFTISFFRTLVYTHIYIAGADRDAGDKIRKSLSRLFNRII